MLHPCFSTRGDMRIVCKVSVVSVTFVIISSVFPWTTASGLMTAKVQAFSDDTATSWRWCCQTLGSREPLRRDVQPRTQPPASLPWPLGCACGDLDSSGCRGLAPDPNLSLAARDRDTCKGHEPGREGVGREERMGDGGGGQRQLRNKNQKQPKESALVPSCLSPCRDS